MEEILTRCYPGNGDLPLRLLTLIANNASPKNTATCLCDPLPNNPYLQSCFGAFLRHADEAFRRFDCVSGGGGRCVTLDSTDAGLRSLLSAACCGKASVALAGVSVSFSWTKNGKETCECGICVRSLEASRLKDELIERSRDTERTCHAIHKLKRVLAWRACAIYWNAMRNSAQKSAFSKFEAHAIKIRNALRKSDASARYFDHVDYFLRWPDTPPYVKGPTEGSAGEYSFDAEPYVLNGSRLQVDSDRYWFDVERRETSNAALNYIRWHVVRCQTLNAPGVGENLEYMKFDCDPDDPPPFNAKMVEKCGYLTPVHKAFVKRNYAWTCDNGANHAASLDCVHVRAFSKKRTRVVDIDKQTLSKTRLTRFVPDSTVQRVALEIDDPDVVLNLRRGDSDAQCGWTGVASTIAEARKLGTLVPLLTMRVIRLLKSNPVRAESDIGSLGRDIVVMDYLGNFEFPRAWCVYVDALRSLKDVLGFLLSGRAAYEISPEMLLAKTRTEAIKHYQPSVAMTLQKEIDHLLSISNSLDRELTTVTAQTLGLFSSLKRILEGPNAGASEHVGKSLMLCEVTRAQKIWQDICQNRLEVALWNRLDLRFCKLFVRANDVTVEYGMQINDLRADPANPDSRHAKNQAFARLKTGLLRVEDVDKCLFGETWISPSNGSFVVRRHPNLGFPENPESAKFDDLTKDNPKAVAKPTKNRLKVYELAFLLSWATLHLKKKTESVIDHFLQAYSVAKEPAADDTDVVKNECRKRIKTSVLKRPRRPNATLFSVTEPQFEAAFLCAKCLLSETIGRGVHLQGMNDECALLAIRLGMSMCDGSNGESRAWFSDTPFCEQQLICDVVAVKCEGNGCKGVDATIIIIDEAALVDLNFIVEVIMPLLVVKGTILICITTPKGSNNLVTQLMNATDSDGKAFFKTLHATTICEECMKKETMSERAACTHGYVPHYKDRANQSKNAELAKVLDTVGTMAQEDCGVILDDAEDNVFDQEVIRKAFDLRNKAVIWDEVYVPERIFVALDPNGLGNSDTALVSFFVSPPAPNHNYDRYVLIGAEAAKTKRNGDISDVFVRHVKKIRNTKPFCKVPIIYLPENNIKNHANDAHDLARSFPSVCVFCEPVGFKGISLKSVGGFEAGVKKREESMLLYCNLLQLLLDRMQIRVFADFFTTSDAYAETVRKTNRTYVKLNDGEVLLKTMLTQLCNVHYVADGKRTKITGKGNGQNDDLAVACLTCVYWASEISNQLNPRYAIYRDLVYTN